MVDFETVSEIGWQRVAKGHFVHKHEGSALRYKAGWRLFFRGNSYGPFSNLKTTAKYCEALREGVSYIIST